MPLRTVAWDIEDAIIAPVDADDNPGTAVPIEGIVSIQAEVRVKSGEQPGDGAIYSVVSKSVGANLTLQMADLQDFGVIATMTGQPAESSGSPLVYTNPVTTRQYPYFLIAGKTFLDDGVGSFHVWVLKAKITGNFALGLADGAFVVPQFTATAVPSLYMTRQTRKVIIFPARYTTDVALAIPPTGIPLTRP